MNKLWRIIISAVAVFGFCSIPMPVKAGVQDFTITSFTADYFLTRDDKKVSNLRVHEEITAQFPNYDQNHGILRAIPETYQNHGLELQVSGVQDTSARPINYETYRENGNLVLKIGNADAYVHGAQTYIIDYTVRGVVTETSAGQSFYWDINGDQWPQVFGHVRARVHVPADLARSMGDPRTCNAGGFGSQQAHCTISLQQEGPGSVVVIDTQDTYPLQPYQTLTVELGFADGTFAPYAPSAWQIQQWVFMAVGLVGVPLVALVIVVREWFRRGRDKQGKRVVVPQYLPPKGVSVLAANAVLKEGFESKAISATIVDLAVRHYVKIFEIAGKGVFKKADYTVELIKIPTDLRPEEKTVVTMLFGSDAKVGAGVVLSSLATTLALKVQALGKSVDDRVAAAGYFVTTHSKAKMPYYVVAGILGVAGFALFGFALLWAIGLLVAAGIFIIGAQAMPARTIKGVELRDYLLGLRDYIKLAEADRLKMLQSPQGDLTQKVDVTDTKQLISLYEKLLPYAMLFGLERDWAATMAPLYAEQPDWYMGHAAFNAAWFAGSLNNFNTAGSVAFTPPSSSGSGGGAGGGGGGGGGGGW